MSLLELSVNSELHHSSSADSDSIGNVRYFVFVYLHANAH